MGVLVHIGNASEMDWIGHYLMMRMRSRRGDRDGEGKVSRPPVPSVPLLARSPARLATEGSRRAVNASHELLSSPLGGGTNSCPHLGALGPQCWGSFRREK